MSLYESMKYLIRIRQLFGLTPISAAANTFRWESNQKLKFFTLFSLIVNITVFATSMLIPTNTFSYAETSIRIALVIFLFVITYVSSLAVILESYFKRNHQQRILNILNNLDKEFNIYLNQNLNYQGIAQSCRRSILFLFCQSIGRDFVFFLLYFYLDSYRSIIFNCLLSPGLTYCLLHYAYSAFLIDLIGEHLKVLNKYLKSMTKSNGYYLRESRKQNKWNRARVSGNMLDASMLGFINRSYSLIWEASKIVNHLMYWSLPIRMFADYFHLVFSTYNFILFMHKDDYATLVASIYAYGTINAAINIFYLSAISQTTIDDVSI